MLRLVDPKTPVRWSHPVDRDLPQDQRTVFHIIPLTVGQERRLRAASLKDDAATLSESFLAFNLELFRQNVIRIESVRLPDGSVGNVESETERIGFLDSLPVEYWPPIFRAIQNTAALDEGTEKN